MGEFERRRAAGLQGIGLLLRLAIIDDDACSFGRQPQADRSSQTSRTARDDRHLVFQLQIHVSSEML